MFFLMKVNKVLKEVFQFLLDCFYRFNVEPKNLHSATRWDLLVLHWPH